MSKKLHFSEELKRLRNKYTMTQLELSAYSGIPLPTIKRWERADSIPSITNIKKLIECYQTFTEITQFEVKNLVELYSLIKTGTGAEQQIISAAPKKLNNERFVGI